MNQKCMASVYAPPGQSINLSNFILADISHNAPVMHMKYLVDMTCTFPLAAILLKILKWLSRLYR